MLYWLIETEEQLQKFESKKYNKVFIEPIYFNDNFHPVLNKISALYIKPLNEDKGYMICIDHDDTLQIEIDKVKSILKQFEEIYVINRKSFIQFFPYGNTIDISFRLNFELNESTKTHGYFYNKWYDKEDINKLIPITKHYEKCELIYNKIKDYCIPNQNAFYSKASTVFSIIESNGIKINEKLFNEYYTPTNKSFSIQNSTIYTQYNLYTTTGRPSNSFNGINFAALKKDESRQCFIPKNDRFIEIDLTAYHPYLVALEIGFEFPNSDWTPYEYFSIIADIPLKDAKVEMIKQLYGEIYEKYRDVPFFKEIQRYKDWIWEQWNEKGEYICLHSKKIFKKSQLGEMTPSKLLSYIIQNLETFINVNLMWDILKKLQGKNTQLILYTYDSFLFDVDVNELNIMEEIKEYMRMEDNKFKIKQGITYDFRN